MQVFLKSLLLQIIKLWRFLTKEPMGISLFMHAMIIFLFVSGFNFQFSETRELMPVESISVNVLDVKSAEKILGQSFHQKRKIESSTDIAENKRKIQQSLIELQKNQEKEEKKSVDKAFSKIFTKMKEDKKIIDEKKSVNKKFSDLLKNLDDRKTKKQESDSKDEKKSSKDKLNDENEAMKTDSSKTDNMLSYDEEEEIKSKIYPNWYIPSGIKDAEKLYVDILIKLRADGTVYEIKVLNKIEDVNFKMAVESAERAIYLSSPLKFSSEKLRNLKEFIVRFNIKDALL